MSLRVWGRAASFVALFAMACQHEAARKSAQSPTAVVRDTNTTRTAPELPIGPVGPAAAALDHPLSRDLSPYRLSKDVERDWLLADVDVIERTRRALPPARRHDELLARLTSPEDGKSVALGFHQTRFERILPGGYSSCRVTLILFDDDLTSVDITCEWPESAPPAVHAVIRDALGPAFEAGETAGYYKTGHVRFDFPRKTSEAREHLAHELGAVAAVEVPAELRDAYELLISPRHTLDIGDTCYEGGAQPDGRVATRKLVAARRADLLRNVLHGQNPEGRLYAARGLREIGALSDADRAVIEKLRHLDLPLSTCSGCAVGAEPSEEVWKTWAQTAL